MAAVLKAVISQRLVPRSDGQGRVPAVEVLITTETVRTCIEDKEKTKQLRDVIAAGTSQYGMQTFDQSLYYLLKQDLITEEEALKRATNVGEFKLKLEGVSSAGDASRAIMENQMTISQGAGRESGGKAPQTASEPILAPKSSTTPLPPPQSDLKIGLGR